MNKPFVPGRATLSMSLCLLAALASASAAAAPIQLVPNTVNMFRDTRGANDVGVGSGEMFQFGANIVGSSEGTSVGAVYPPTGFTVSQFPCVQLAINSGFCVRTSPYNTTRLDPWTLRFTNGSDSLTVTGPSLVGSDRFMPFPASVTLSGSGLTPTISWTLPSGYAPDAIDVVIYDKGKILANGTADQIHRAILLANTSSYTIPDILSSGQHLVQGGNYAINLRLDETRNHVTFTPSNSNTLHRTSSFFDFTPLSGNNPPNVALPTVVSGVYNFSVGNVGPTSTTFIDPDVAIGYDYAIGAGNPNFASVLLPNVGDGQFDLDYLVNGQAVHSLLAHDVQFFFPQGGVGAFRVSGIETSAMLDPANVTAFITGLTFAANGEFTGTMTPLTQFVPGAVPEPATVALMLAGIVLIGMRRKSRSR
jgi:hypothetical protein